MSSRPTRKQPLHADQLGKGTRNDPIRVDAHRKKMFIKFTRSLEIGRTRMSQAIARGARSRSNVSQRVLNERVARAKKEKGYL